LSSAGKKIVRILKERRGNRQFFYHSAVDKIPVERRHAVPFKIIKNCLFVSKSSDKANGACLLNLNVLLSENQFRVYKFMQRVGTPAIKGVKKIL
jgi:hypothetical protein